MENNLDPELYETLPPSYLHELIQNAEAQRQRLCRAAELLDPGDMLVYHVENVTEHLDSLIEGWRADAETALNWR